ncbi:MAG: hypothetical protein MR945_04860 [Agathobacter sp.]|nr:hypothetical protein [Agathobacter sp.]
MGRYVRHELLNQPEDFVQYMMNDFLSKHGFQFVEFKGQMVFRAGGGWFEMPKFLVWSYQNGVFHMEAWIRMLILPGVYSKENDMSGFYGALPKKMYKDDLEQLMSLLHQPVGNAQQNTGQPMPGNSVEGMTGNRMPQGNGPIVVQGVDTSRYANMALGFGITGLALCWTLFGLFFGILSIIYAVKGKGSAKKGRATAGMVCAIIALVITTVLYFLNILAAAL